MNDADSRLFQFIARLKTKNIAFTLSSVRDDAIMFHVAVPGERWEIEFFPDGSVEVERFRSPGEIDDDASIELLFAQFGD